MKHIVLPLVFITLIMNAHGAFAQKFRIASPPVNGWFYMDTTDCKNKPVPGALSAKCIDVICENNVVIASEAGQVLYCEPHSNKTYEIAIKYGSSIVVYNNITKRKVQRMQKIQANAEIGEVPLNPKDQHYHLGMQVAQVRAPNRFLWYEPLLNYFNASLITN